MNTNENTTLHTNNCADKVAVKREGANLVSLDGTRKFVPYGEPEWAWWIEVKPDGSEIPGLWEYWDTEGAVVRMTES